ncbi:MAG TPA: hypothetical protein VIJ75_09010 [Hanamia sp.]
MEKDIALCPMLATNAPSGLSLGTATEIKYAEFACLCRQAGWFTETSNRRG